MDARRIAHNEGTYRRINEGIERGRVIRHGPTGFLCECGRIGCNEVVELTIDEYERVRSDPRWFAVVSGHDTEHDAVIGREEGYVLVQKIGEAARIAEEADPRSDS